MPKNLLNQVPFPEAVKEDVSEGDIFGIKKSRGHIGKGGGARDVPPKSTVPTVSGGKG